MEELTKCPDGKMRECGSDGKEHAILVTSEMCSVCIPLKETIKKLEKELYAPKKDFERKTPEEHAEEKATIEQLRVTVEENYAKKEQFVKELTHLINRLGLDSRCETPDYIIAELLYESFDSFVTAMDKKNLIKSSDEAVPQQLTCGHTNFLKFKDIATKCTICGVGTIKE